MDRTTDAAIQSLSQLARAAGFKGDARKPVAQRAATAIGGIEPSQWLPREDLQYYLGLAEFYASEWPVAERHLADVPADSPCGGEALWLRAQISSRGESSGTGQASALAERYQELAAARPLSPISQFVADQQTDQREAAAGGDASSRSVPVVKLGRRYDWQTLVQIGELYERQGMLADAARAYGWSAEVRFPQEWLDAGVADVWQRIADCHARLGDNHAAFRWLAKCFGLPIATDLSQSVAARLRSLTSAAPLQPPPVRPDAPTLLHIADLLLTMEMFDQAVAAYQQAADQGADVGSLVAAALQAKAVFLFEYRAERNRHTMLMGAPLTWARVVSAFEEARQHYADAGAAARAGTERCEQFIERIRQRSAAESAP